MNIFDLITDNNRLMNYSWQLSKWPKFTYDDQKIQDLLVEFAFKSGEVSGYLQGLSADMKQQALIQLMIAEAVATSKIEGEFLSREDVMSSIKNNLGLNEKRVFIRDKRAEGIGNLMLKIQETINDPLTLSELKTWHKQLFEGNHYIQKGKWRKGSEPMQVVSGPIGKETVHFEAPPSQLVPELMRTFVKWYNADSSLKKTAADSVIHSAIAHLYFETIHPFEDGNGRIGRAISQKALSRSFDTAAVFSLSATIEKNKKAYYAELKKAQSSLDITAWIIYFAGVILKAQKDVAALIRFTLIKSNFFDKYKGKLNLRQLKAINKMLDQGPAEFKGGMTTKKYVSITKTSRATATRDLQELKESGILYETGKGRSVSYQLILE